MPVDERTRRVMLNSLVRVHGEEVADTIMAHLPPTGWGDVAMKKDVEHLQEVLTLRIDSVAGQIESTANQLRTEMSRGNIKVIVSVVIAILGQPFAQAFASHIR